MTHASRDTTTTGLNFEKQIVIKNDGICLTKNNLQDKYRDMLDYIRNEVKDCDYIIVGD